jgi:glycine hydroxymethyltransferase
MAALVVAERERQIHGIELIASENFTSRAVMQCLGSCLTNKYSEGQPGERYYGGTEVIDKIEVLCKSRALKAFNLDPKEWCVNVQPYSGSPANFAVYTALLNPHDRIMGLDLPSGGHLTHGFYTPKTKVSATSVYFESLPYQVHPETGLIDFENLAKMAALYRPKLIVAGASAYPRDVDLKKFREICNNVGALLMMDMAHISGLVATTAQGKCALVTNPFEYADVVTTTTHKSLRGPRAGMIFSKKTDNIPDIEKRIDNAVFPALQGGPHNHQIGGLAVQLLEAVTDEFHEYQQNVVKNSRALAEILKSNGHKLATDGTDNHLILLDVRPHSLTGSKVDKVCNLCHITLNKNTVPGDKSALTPGGVRIGTCAMTTRGCMEDDFKAIGEFVHRAISICVEQQKQTGPKLVDFCKGLEDREDLKALKMEVQAWAAKFGYPE